MPQSATLESTAAALPLLLTIPEVQRQLSGRTSLPDGRKGSSRSFVYNLITSGELQTAHFGRAVRVTRDSLLALIKRSTDPERQSQAPSETRVLLKKALVRSRRSPKQRRATAIPDSPGP
jgi:hypothetical protein